MNYVLNYAVLVFAGALFLFYLASFVLNIFRSKEVKKILSSNCASVTGVVKDVIIRKKKAFIKVRFTSPVNKMLFEGIFEYLADDWGSRKQIGEEIEIIYPEISKLKRVYAFPTFLDGDKVKMPIGPIFTDLIIVLFSGYILAQIIMNMAKANAFTESVALTTVTPGLLLVVYGVMHLFLITYVIDRFLNAPYKENQNYLQIYGIHTNAEVTTFKFAGAKNSKGFKESQMEIEYFNGQGEKIKARCQSYYYSETQEQFVSILYDPKNYKNVVYIKQPEKRKKSK